MMSSRFKKCFVKEFVRRGGCVFAALAMILTSMLVINVSAASSDQIAYFGTALPCEKDNGYIPLESGESGSDLWQKLTFGGALSLILNSEDPHAGWSLGSFFVKGYSGVIRSDLNCYNDAMPVYLKNAGDIVSFGFKLEQDINKLNGNDKLTISEDKKIIQDCWVQDPYFKGDIGHGILIVVHTNYRGEQTITTYTDFLLGKSMGAETEVQLFEEGDYRVVLCYEIYKHSGWNWATDWLNPDGSWFNYRIESYFSVRNGNAMIYPFDSVTNAELINKSYTENGFRVDLANSHYLQLSVKKENLNEGGTEIVEDTRFNKVVADNTVFEDEGKYTITVKNQYTGLVTEKTIYVGTNNIMKCNAVTGLSITEINQKIKEGYEINSDGTLSKISSPGSAGQIGGGGSTDQTNSGNADADQTNSGNLGKVVIIILSIAAIVAIASFAGRKRRKL